MKPVKNASTILISDDYTLIMKKTYGDRGWVSPGGMIDGDETPFEAAVRELDEEAGVELCMYQLQDMYSFQSGDTEVYVIELYRMPEVYLSSEHSRYVWVHLEDVRDYKLSRYQAKTFGLMGW